jgi:hypothetical protein
MSLNGQAIPVGGIILDIEDVKDLFRYHGHERGVVFHGKKEKSLKK